MPTNHGENHMRIEIPAYLLAWMQTQSQSAFIGDMLQVHLRTGGLTEQQLIEVKVRYIQAGHDIPR
jgi:hypothetical protein